MTKTEVRTRLKALQQLHDQAIEAIDQLNSSASELAGELREHIESKSESWQEDTGSELVDLCDELEAYEAVIDDVPTL